MQAPFWSESELFSSDCEIIRGRITKKSVKISQKPTFAGGAHRRSSFLFPFSVASGHTVHSGARILCFPFPVSPEGYRLWQDAFFVSAHPAFHSPGTYKEPPDFPGVLSEIYALFLRFREAMFCPAFAGRHFASFMRSGGSRAAASVFSAPHPRGAREATATCRLLPCPQNGVPCYFCRRWIAKPQTSSLKYANFGLPVLSS